VDVRLPAARLAALEWRCESSFWLRFTDTRSVLWPSRLTTAVVPPTAAPLIARTAAILTAASFVAMPPAALTLRPLTATGPAAAPGPAAATPPPTNPATPPAPPAPPPAPVSPTAPSTDSFNPALGSTAIRPPSS
jgi:hypothetical protein